MKTVDIAETISDAIEETIFKKWKHEGHVDGVYANGVSCHIDGKDYLIKISGPDWELAN